MMNTMLHMVELRPSLEGLFRFLADHNLNREQDEDFGYGMHVWLKAAFGDTAPKPFRISINQRNGSRVRVLGYTGVSGKDLIERMETYAEPAVYTICRPDMIMSKPMNTRWPKGRRFAFEVLVSPVSRRDGIEKDTFLRQADITGQKAGLRREDVYADWFSRQVEGAVHLHEIRLDGFRLVRYYRKKVPQRQGKMILPQALIRGILEVDNTESFSDLLVRGIGRHRAFGYGMLLLRPA